MSESDTDYEFIGSKNSYYSAKVRACLQYKRLPYSMFVPPNFDLLDLQR